MSTSGFVFGGNTKRHSRAIEATTSFPKRMSCSIVMDKASPLLVVVEIKWQKSPERAVVESVGLMPTSTIDARSAPEGRSSIPLCMSYASATNKKPWMISLPPKKRRKERKENNGGWHVLVRVSRLGCAPITFRDPFPLLSNGDDHFPLSFFLGPLCFLHCE